MMAEQTPPARPTGRTAGGDVFTRKYGPLPGWVWAAGAAGGAILLLWIRHRTAKASTDTVDTSGSTADGVDYSGELATIQSEIIGLQGAGGEQGTSGAAGGTTTPTGTTGGGTTKPTGTTTTPKPNPKPPAPKTKYITVTVVPYTKDNPPWNSTLSGIAAHYHVAGGYQALAKLNGIADPNVIRTGQKIKVPVQS